MDNWPINLESLPPDASNCWLVKVKLKHFWYFPKRAWADLNNNISSHYKVKQSVHLLQRYLLHYEVPFPIRFLICWWIVGGCIIRNITMTRSWLLLSVTLMQYQHYLTLIITHHANMTTNTVIQDQIGPTYYYLHTTLGNVCNKLWCR